MTSNYIYLDVETQFSKDEVGGWYPEDMKVSLAVTFDEKNQLRTWFEQDALRLVNELNQFETIIGFNILDFDLKVLSSYSDTQNLEVNTKDLLDEIYKKLGFRVKLDDLVYATLGKRKSATGLQSLTWWKEGKIDLIEEYCKNDVLLTKDLYDYGSKNGYIYFPNYETKKTVEVDWEITKAAVDTYPLPPYIIGVERLEVIERNKILCRALLNENINLTQYKLHATNLFRTALSVRPSGISTIEEEVYFLKSFFEKPFADRLSESDTKSSILSNSHEKFISDYQDFVIQSQFPGIDEKRKLAIIFNAISTKPSTEVQSIATAIEFQNIVTSYFAFVKNNTDSNIYKKENLTPIDVLSDMRSRIKSNGIDKINKTAVLQTILSIFPDEHQLLEHYRKQDISNKIEYIDRINLIITEFSGSNNLEISEIHGIAEIIDRLFYIADNDENVLLKLDHLKNIFKEYINYFVGNEEFAKMDYSGEEVEIMWSRTGMKLPKFDVETKQILVNGVKAIFGKKVQNSKEGCYIATLVYGNYCSPEVIMLRKYRDESLNVFFIGRLIIKTYYWISPKIIYLFGQSIWFRYISKSLIEIIFYKKINKNR